jgi:hypothetical protein
VQPEKVAKMDSPSKDALGVGVTNPDDTFHLRRRCSPLKKCHEIVPEPADDRADGPGKRHGFGVRDCWTDRMMTANEKSKPG